MKDYVVYKLIDPRTKDIRYVGKTTNGLHARLKDHLAVKRGLTLKDHCHRWLNQLVSLGLLPEAEVIERCTDPYHLIDREIFWIAEHRRLGHPLTNDTDGGPGATGYRWTEKQTERMRTLMSCSGNPMFGQGHRQVGRKNPMYGKGWKISGSKNPAAKAVVDVRTGKRYETMTEAAQDIGITIHHVSRLCYRGRSKSGRGHFFMFADDYSVATGSSVEEVSSSIATALGLDFGASSTTSANLAKSKP